MEVVRQLKILRTAIRYCIEKFPAQCDVRFSDTGSAFRHYNMYIAVAPVTPVVLTSLIEPAFKSIDFAEVSYRPSDTNPRLVLCRVHNIAVLNLLARFLNATGRPFYSNRVCDYMGFLISHLVRLAELWRKYIEFPLSDSYTFKQVTDTAITARLCKQIIDEDTHLSKDPIIEDLRRLISAWK